MFEQLIVWCVVGHCHGETLGPFYWSLPASGIAVFGASHWFAELYFSDVMVLLEFRKLQWIRPEADHQTVTMIFFGCKFGFGKCFGASSWSNYWGGHHQLSYKIHFSLHVTTKWRHVLLLLHRIIEDDTSKWQFLKFWSADEAPIYWAFSPFKFASNEFFKFLCSCKRINFDYSSQFIVVNFVTGHCAFHHQGSHLLCKASWTTTALYIY